MYECVLWLGELHTDARLVTSWVVGSGDLGLLATTSSSCLHIKGRGSVLSRRGVVAAGAFRQAGQGRRGVNPSTINDKSPVTVWGDAVVLLSLVVVPAGFAVQHTSSSPQFGLPLRILFLRETRHKSHVTCHTTTQKQPLKKINSNYLKRLAE
jgi:hypothetical protein